MGTIKRGPLSKSRKNRLDPLKIKAKRQLLANPHLVRGYRFSASFEASHVRPRTRNRFSASLEASHERPRTAYRISASLEASHEGPRTVYRFSVSPEAPRVKPRMRCRFSASLKAGSATTPSPPPRPISPIERHVQLMRPTTPVTSAGRRLDTAEWPTRREVASTPYRPGQDRAGVTGHCALMLCPRPTPALHCAT